VEKAHAAWSSFVRKRALGMCEYCGGLGSDAHHIYGRKAHPALRFAPINGIALCRRCHNEWHAAPISRRGWFAVMYPASWSMLQTFVRDGLKGA
jgi:5-methylcytosine-specific restriction endonuclease McrA